MEDSDKVLPYCKKKNPYQNKTKRGKKGQKFLPDSYRISIPSKATRRGKQIPCHLIFPSSEDNLISIKKFRGGEKWKGNAEQYRPRAETSGYGTVALYFRRRQGKARGFQAGKFEELRTE